ncbi:translin family protein [Methanosarcina horonobensis]|uniref:hypothetical protein n=1 Tax=Methanosarcina horonobensis TaxID=418008 RepID=UPI000A4C420B|nr:hypothetical protein [Methanosarcina horonobensis]
MLEEISNRIRENLEVKDRIREEGLKISREIVRECRTASFALHGEDFEKAGNSIEAAGKALKKSLRPDLRGMLTFTMQDL